MVSYFRNEVAQDLNPHLKADLLDSFKALIDLDPTIPDSKRESLKVLQGGEVSQPLMAFAFFFSIGLFVFLIGFYFFLWRRDI